MLMCALLLPIAHETAGAARTRHSLRPLISGGRSVSSKPRAQCAARTRSRAESKMAIRTQLVTVNPGNDGVAFASLAKCVAQFLGHLEQRRIVLHQALGAVQARHHGGHELAALAQRNEAVEDR